MKFKRFSVLMLVIVMVFSFTACTQAKETDVEKPATNEEKVENEVGEEVKSIEPIDIRVGALKGPTGMGMVGLMENSEMKKAQMNYTFELLGTPDEMVGKVVSGELDIAAVPTNMALLLNNKTQGQVQLLAANTLGVLYILENGESISSLADLEGKTLNLSGKGASPDYILQYLLKENKIEGLQIDYSLEHADLAAAMVSGDVKLGLLPQPHVTTTTMKNQSVRVALDLTKEWERVHGADLPLIMGVLVVQKDFAEKNPQALEIFLDEYKASVDFVNQSQEEAGLLIEKFGVLPNAKIAQNAITASNIVFMDAQESKEALEQFFKILFDFNPKSIGGALADETFYHQRMAN